MIRPANDVDDSIVHLPLIILRIMAGCFFLVNVRKEHTIRSRTVGTQRVPELRIFGYPTESNQRSLAVQIHR